MNDFFHIYDIKEKSFSYVSVNTFTSNDISAKVRFTFKKYNSFSILSNNFFSTWAARKTAIESEILFA